MDYRINWDGCDGVFAVPDSVSDGALKLAKGNSIKVLLYLLKYKDIPSDPAKIGVSEDDIEDALFYWEKMGVICKCGNKTAPAPTVTQADVKKVQPKSAETEKYSADRESVFGESSESDVKVLRRQQKAVLPDEIAKRLQSSDDVALIFKCAEEAFSRSLNFEEQRTLLWINDYLGLSPHVVVMLVGYCTGIGKYSMSYIERVAIDWDSRSINTPELAEKELVRLQKCSTLEGKVVSSLELHRKLTSKETEFISHWADMGISIDLIMYAYDLSIPNTGKLSFSYMNKILTKWHENSVKSVSDAKALNERTRPQKKANYTPKSAAPQIHLPSDIPSSPSYDLQLIFEHARNTVPQVSTVDKR
ncbi:MAG: DnaD domain protein [Oscillospiraceae bacterium]|nr:DnaD domain protein [Oscillospiraceae bacterium]